MLLRFGIAVQHMSVFNAQLRLSNGPHSGPYGYRLFIGTNSRSVAPV